MQRRALFHCLGQQGLRQQVGPSCCHYCYCYCCYYCCHWWESFQPTNRSPLLSTSSSSSFSFCHPGGGRSAKTKKQFRYTDYLLTLTNQYECHKAHSQREVGAHGGRSPFYIVFKHTYVRISTAQINTLMFTAFGSEIIYFL